MNYKKRLPFLKKILQSDYLFIFYVKRFVLWKFIYNKIYIKKNVMAIILVNTYFIRYGFVNENLQKKI